MQIQKDLEKKTEKKKGTGPWLICPAQLLSTLLLGSAQMALTPLTRGTHWSASHLTEKRGKKKVCPRGDSNTGRLALEHTG